MRFEQALPFGRAAECDMGRWFHRQGYFTLPPYEKLTDDGKGPRLIGPARSYICPDLLVCRRLEVFWAEVKHKGAFTWHRQSGRWVTGIDLRHYEDYCRLHDEGPFPVVLFFLHRGGQAKDSPPNSPTGLYAGDIGVLRRQENHRYENGGNADMVYWARREDGGPLRKLAELADVLATEEAA